MTLLNEPNSSDPNKAGAGPAIRGTIYMMVLLLLFVVPIGVGTALYLEEYANRERWYNRLLEINIQNLAAVPSIVYGILGLAFLVRGIGLGPRAACRSTHPDLARASHRDRVQQGGDPCGAGLDPSGSLCARSHTMAGRTGGRSSLPRFRASPPDRSSRSHGRSARRRRFSLSGALTYVAVNPTLLGSFTALPVQIYQWIGRPQEEFRLLAAAGIIVLLVILLTMNAFAIWLRNRYQRRW